MLPFSVSIVWWLAAVEETFLTGVLSDLPVAAFVVAQASRENITIVKRTQQEARTFAEDRDLTLLEVRKDATVGKAHDAVTPLVLYRPAQLARVDGTHRFDDRPPPALVGFETVVDWIEEARADPEQVRHDWRRRRLRARSDAARDQQPLAKASS
jgi:hypothetical protein